MSKCRPHRAGFGENPTSDNGVTPAVKHVLYVSSLVSFYVNDILPFLIESLSTYMYSLEIFDNKYRILTDQILSVRFVKVINRCSVLKLFYIREDLWRLKIKRMPK